MERKVNYNVGDRAVPPGSFADVSIIEIYEHVPGSFIVQLRATFNADAECCYEDQDGNPRKHINWEDDAVIQAEEYSSRGWHCKREDPRLATADGYWGLWDAWNGRMSGGISLYDDNTVADIRNDLETKPHVFYDEIKNLPPGDYVVIGKREDYEKEEKK